MPKLCAGQLIAMITALAVFSYAMPQPAAAQSHVVDLSELHQQLNQSHQARANDIADIEQVLSLPAAREALAKTRINMDQVRVAIAELNDAELSRLADRARAIEKDVEGGIIVGLLALIGLVVVILVVLAVVRDDE